jgi:hypothetical protein
MGRPRKEITFVEEEQEQDNVLVISPNQKQKLESLFKTRFEDASSLVSAIEAILSVHPEPFKPFALAPRVTKIFGMREGKGGLTAQQHLERVIRDATAKSAGGL